MRNDSTCAVVLRASTRNDSTNIFQRGALFYPLAVAGWNPGIIGKPLIENIASFLIMRGPYAYMGFAWQGCTCSGEGMCIYRMPRGYHHQFTPFACGSNDEVLIPRSRYKHVWVTVSSAAGGRSCRSWSTVGFGDGGRAGCVCARVEQGDSTYGLVGVTAPQRRLNTEPN